MRSRIVTLLRRVWAALPGALVSWRCSHLWRHDRDYGVKQMASGHFRVGAVCAKCGARGTWGIK